MRVTSSITYTRTCPACWRITWAYRCWTSCGRTCGTSAWTQRRITPLSRCWTRLTRWPPSQTSWAPWATCSSGWRRRPRTPTSGWSGTRPCSAWTCCLTGARWPASCWTPSWTTWSHCSTTPTSTRRSAWWSPRCRRCLIFAKTCCTNSGRWSWSPWPPPDRPIVPIQPSIATDADMIFNINTISW